MNRDNPRIILLIVTAVFLLSVTAGFLAPVQMMELKVRNTLFELRGPLDTTHSDIVIIEMSQSADDEIPYKYPWPTYIYGNLIENLNRAGVRAIGIDVIFDQPDLYGPQNDSLFASAIKEYGNVVLAARAHREEHVGPEGAGASSSRIIGPNNILRNSSPNPSGLVNMDSDEDEFIRRYLLSQHVMDQPHYSFALEMIRILSVGSGSELPVSQKKGLLSFGPYDIPVFRGNTMLINYYGGGRTFDYIGFEEIIDDQDFQTVTEREAFEMNLFDDPEYGILHQDILQDKIALVGATMPELQDIHPVPVKDGRGNSTMAGVEIHAHALQNILDGNFLLLAPEWVHFLIVFLFACLIVLITSRLSMWGGLLSTAGLLCFWILISGYLFVYNDVVLFYLGPVISIITGYIWVTAYHYVREEKENRRIREMFSSYVSPDLVKRMIESGDFLHLGGRETQLTALFTDIAGFTALSEKLTPSRLFGLMNEYLERMTSVIIEDEGTLDKYIGDAIMAFYGAPAPVSHHAVHACRSAIKMQDSLKQLRLEWKTKGGENLPEILNLKMRIGINTGRMVVGNMGSSLRFNYTVLGDHVNLAARCEAICKEYDVEIIVTEHTHKEAKKAGDLFQFRFLDQIRVKGRSEPVRIYELAGFKDPQLPGRHEAAIHESGEGG